MYLFRKIILWLIPITWIIGFELMKEEQQWWWLILLVLLLQQVATIFFVCKKKINLNFFHFLILPVLFSLASWLFMIFIIDPVFYHLTVVASALVVYILIHQYYLYFYVPYRYQPYSLESMSLYISLIAGFFFYAAAFGGLVLLQLNVWLVALVLMLSMGLVTYQYFWVNKFNVKKNWLFVLIIILVLTEIFIAVSYLPTGFYVNSFIIVLSYYLMLGFSKHYLSQTLNKKRSWMFILIGGLCLLAVLFSAKWG